MKRALMGKQSRSTRVSIKENSTNPKAPRKSLERFIQQIRSRSEMSKKKRKDKEREITDMVLSKGFVDPVRAILDIKQAEPPVKHPIAKPAKLKPPKLETFHKLSKIYNTKMPDESFLKNSSIRKSMRFSAVMGSSLTKNKVAVIDRKKTSSWCTSAGRSRSSS